MLTSREAMGPSVKRGKQRRRRRSLILRQLFRSDVKAFVSTFRDPLKDAKLLTEGCALILIRYYSPKELGSNGLGFNPCKILNKRKQKNPSVMPFITGQPKSTIDLLQAFQAPLASSSSGKDVTNQTSCFQLMATLPDGFLGTLVC